MELICRLLCHVLVRNLHPAIPPLAPPPRSPSLVAAAMVPCAGARPLHPLQAPLFTATPSISAATGPPLVVLPACRRRRARCDCCLPRRPPALPAAGTTRCHDPKAGEVGWSQLSSRCSGACGGGAPAQPRPACQCCHRRPPAQGRSAGGRCSRPAAPEPTCFHGVLSTVVLPRLRGCLLPVELRRLHVRLGMSVCVQAQIRFPD